MNGFSENIKSINSFAKTGLSAILVTLFALISYFTNTTVFQPLLEDRHALKTTQNQLKSTQLELEQSQKQFRAATVKIEKLETAMRLLKIDHRLAQIKVLSITK
ncbi:MAG: hypothetical protein VX438_17485, partial [Planctomycetota bacterium]|nr:hypothetical protein [Planctomycetota bacterium]